MPLELLPDELLLLVASQAVEGDINHLAQANRRLYTVLNYYLYQRNAQSSRCSALTWAARRGNVETANKILDQGVLRDAATQHGVCLALAIKHSQEAMVKRLLKLRDVKMIYSMYSLFSSISIWSVMDTEHEGILRLLVQDGRADLNHRVKYQKTPLLLASKSKRFNLVEILLESDTIEVDVRSGARKETPLCYAAFHGHEKGVKLLLAKGADPNIYENARSPLGYAAWGGHHQIVKMLLDAGADINHRNRQQKTPLLFAAAGGSVEAVRMLLEAGSDPNSESAVGATPILHAAESKHEPVVRLLMEYGAKTEVYTGFRKSPLLSAAENGDEATVKLLLDHGHVDIERLDGFLRLTPLCWAAWNGHAGVVRMLLEKGADPNVGRGNLKRTPLSFAADSGHLAVVETLLEWGVELDHCEQQQSPVSYAAKNGHHKIVKLLIERGANIDIQAHTVKNIPGMGELLSQVKELSLGDR